MKNLKLLMLITTVMLFSSLHSQELTRSVFASSGKTTSNGDLYLSWTIGQSGLVGTFIHEDTLTFNVGFQQYDTTDISTNVQLTYSSSNLSVFPNPFHQEFYFSLKSEEKGEVSYYLYDNNGKIVQKKQHIPVNTNFIEKKVDLINHPPGIYNLTLFYFPKKNSPTQFSIKLIKL